MIPSFSGSYQSDSRRAGGSNDVCAHQGTHTHSLLLLVVFVSMFVFMIVAFGEESSETRVGDLIKPRISV